MEQELLLNAGNPEKIKSILVSKKVNEILSLVDRLLLAEESDSNVNLLESATYGIYSHEELLDICEGIIDRLWTRPVPESYHTIFALFLNNAVECLEDWKLERFCVHIIRKLSTDCSHASCIFTTLGKAVLRLESSSVILTPMVESLCNADWSSENTLGLIEALKDYPMSLEPKGLVLKKVLSKLALLDSHIFTRALKAIFLFSCSKTLPLTLDHLRVEFSSESVDHTTMKDETFALTFELCNQSEQFGTDLLLAIKNSPQDVILSEFIFALLLTVLPIPYLQTQSLRLLNSTLLAAFTDGRLISESAFLRDLCDVPEDPAALILRLSQKCFSTSGRQLSQGLILLGFGLLRASAHSAGSALVASRGTRASTAVKVHKPNTSPFVSQHHTNVRAGRLATEVLVHLFKHCSQTRQAIMDILVNILWSESSSPIALKLADLLADLVATSPLEVAMLVDRLDSVLNSIGLIPVELSIGLVHALLPLIRAGNQLVDAWSTSQQPTENPMNTIRARLVTTLCKAAASPRVHCRRTAVACFLLLLKHLKVSVSAFRSASQHSSGNLSQSMPFTQTQATQLNPYILYSQLQSTQFAQQAIVLPCDVNQNEALCTEIVSVLHRIIFSAFFRSQAGSLLEDPENKVKSDIYWGLCEVVARNKGLCEPVLNLYLRLLLASLSPSFLRELKRTQPLASLTVPTVVETSQPAVGATGPPVRLDELITAYGSNETEIRRTEHPDILVWCLQSVLTLPQFASSWRQYRLKRAQAQDSSANGSSDEASQSASMGFSQFTQSTAAGSVACGRAVSSSLFSKAVTLLLALSDSLRFTPLDDFGLSSDTEFGNTSIGNLNRERANLLLGLYDACLELELKDPLELISTGGVQQTQSGNQAESSWSRIRQLFARRVALSNLVNNKMSGSQPSTGSLLLPACGQGAHFRPGLLILGLISASHSGLSRVLRASSSSDAANSLAYHLLLTISTRLSQFTRCAGGGIPYAYRDPLVQAMISILRHVIRYYNHKLLTDLDPSTTPPAPAANVNASTLSIGAPDSDPSAATKLRHSPLAATYSAALGVLDVAFTLAMDYLGSKRLHRLTVKIYSTTSDPSYRYPQFEQHAVSEFTEEGEEDDEDDDSSERRNPDITPAQALSAVIKLIKGWITKLLNPNSGTSFVSTQKVSPHAVSHTRDLVVLIPLLVRLCRARATIGSDESSRTVNTGGNLYGGLDRVLAWLIRLMRSATPQSSSKSGSEASGLLTAARVQLVCQTVWLAHLVESFNNDPSHDSASQLNLDYLLTTLAADIHHTMKDAAAVQDTSYLPDDSEGTVTFSMVTRVSAMPLLNLLYSTVRQIVTEFEWLLAQLTPSLGGRVVTESSHCSKVDQLRSEGNAREEALCTRLSTVGETLSELLKTAIPAPSTQADSLLEVSARIFNFLTQFVKYYLRIVRRRCGRFPVLFERVVRVYGKDVSPNAYAFISYIQHAESEKIKVIQDKQPLKKTEKDAQKNTAKTISKKTSQQTNIPQTMMSRSIKDSRVIPQLVFAIEQYERFLMQLSKLSKVNLMRNVKLAVSRDFRINTATVAAQLERSALLSPSSESDVEGGDENVEAVTETSATAVVEPAPENSETASSQRPSGSLVDLRLPDSNGSPIQLSVPTTQDETVTPRWGRAVKPNAARLSALKRHSKATDPENTQKKRR